MCRQKPRTASGGPGRSPSVGRLLVCGISALALTVTACGDEELSAASSCRDYLDASQEEQYNAVTRIAGERRAVGAVSPLGRPYVSSQCVKDPHKTLGAAVEEAG